MVDNFRQNPSGGKTSAGTTAELTNFAHFALVRVLQLLKDNKISDGTETLDDLIANKNNFGIKVYLSQHVVKDDCPTNPYDYIGRNTVVLVNTEYNYTNKLWYDLLSDDLRKPNFVDTSGFDTDDKNSKAVNMPSKGVDRNPAPDDKDLAAEGQGLDKVELCPPQCHLFGNSL